MRTSSSIKFNRPTLDMYMAIQLQVSGLSILWETPVSQLSTSTIIVQLVVQLSIWLTRQFLEGKQTVSLHLVLTRCLLAHLSPFLMTELTLLRNSWKKIWKLEVNLKLLWLLDFLEMLVLSIYRNTEQR